MINLIKELENNAVQISLNDEGRIQLSSDNEISDSVITMVKSNEKKLINYLQSYSGFDIPKPISKIASSSSYALSSSQRRLWLLSQLEGGSVAYNMPLYIKLNGQYDLTLFKKAIADTIDRHEILRTVFKTDINGDIRQFVLKRDSLDFIVRYEDFSEEEYPDEKIKAYVQTDNLIAFDLENGPLLRMSLLKISSDDHVFYFNMHHIISDGWSMEILARDVFNIYIAYKENTTPSIPELTIQYKDYAAWQLEQLETDLFNKHKQYWISKLNGELPVINLPAFRKRPSTKTFKGKTLIAYIDKDPLRQLKEYARKNDGTLFMAIVASLKILLYRYTNQNDLIVGTPIAGRQDVDLENQIGFYVNAVAIRNYLSDTYSFDKVFDTVKKTIIENHNHQDYPFDKLVDELNHARSANRNAVFDIMVVLQNTVKEQDYSHIRRDLHAITEGDYTTSIYDIKFEFVEDGDYLKISVEYNIEIYDKEIIIHFIDHYRNLLAELLSKNNTEIRYINYLTTEESTAPLKNAHFEKNRQYPKNESIVSLFENVAARFPKHISLIFEEEKINYKDLNFKVNQLAHFLIHTIKIKAEEKIALLLDPGFDTIISILAILKSGGVYVPIDTTSAIDRVNYILTDTQARILVTQASYIETAAVLQWQLDSLQSYLCIDSENIYQETDSHENLLMSQHLWDHVGERSSDQISGGGWLSSYTGLPIPEIEMEEYAQNVYKKLSPHISFNSRVLEIGCSSGLTLSKISPEVAFYYATDLSPMILSKTEQLAKQLELNNVKFKQCPAHEISKIEEEDFDLIIINSVIQHFHGHNYLRKVINDCIKLLNNKGFIFIGDIMDLHKKESLITDLIAFESENSHTKFKTKTDFSSELFVAKHFFHDLTVDTKEISDVIVSDKIFTIENELTKYRYDVILQIDKLPESKKSNKLKYKNQYDKKALSIQACTNPDLGINPNQLAYIIYTSGTTGEPKGVMVEHKNVVRLLKYDIPIFDFSELDTWVMFHSYAFDFSVWEMYGALLNGAKLLIIPKIIAKDTKSFLELLKKQKVTVLNQTPSAFYNLIACEKEFTHSSDADLNIRYVILGGEALHPVKIKDWYFKYSDCNFINMYGITETTVHTTFKKITKNDVENYISNIGKAIPTVSCFILDANMQLVPSGVEGELYVSGAGVSRGYLNKPALTKDRFIDNPFIQGDVLYRSGDKVRLLSNGDIDYIGRNDHQVKIRGFRIELGEIENRLLKFNGIEKAIVLINETHLEKELIAYYVPANKIDESELRLFLKKSLPIYMLPAYLIELQHIPLTSNGKIDKNKLLGLRNSAPENEHYIYPDSALQHQLVSIWQKILNRATIGIVDDFFELGGHSLKATRLLNEYHKAFEIKLQLKELFTHTTIKSHETLIQNATGIKYQSISKIASSSSYVLSSSQRRLWLLSQLEGGSVAYNMPFYIKLNGQYDLTLFKKAIADTIDRHEILRTVFKTDINGDIRQFVLKRDSLDFIVRYEDFSEEEYSDEKIKAYVQTDNLIAFDLENGPLLRMSLLKISSDDHVFYFNMHHIISDGWSMEILARDVFNIYIAYKENTTPSIPELTIQYKDYAAWQLEQLETDLFNKHKQYWISKLNGELPSISLNNKKIRPKIKSYSGNTLGTYISEKSLQKSKAYANHHGGSLFMLLLANLNLLIHRYTGLTDIVIGSPVSGRDHIDFKDQIGFYVNTLVSRNSIDFNDSFTQLFHKIKNSFLESSAHHIYPFDKIVDDLTLKRDTSRNPVFDIMLAFHNNEVPSNSDEINIDLFKTEDEIIDFGTKLSKFDLLIDVREYKDKLLLMAEYNTDIYEMDEIARMIIHFKNILDKCLDSPVNSITSVDYLTAQERETVLHTFNQTDKPFDSSKNVIDLFHLQVQKNPQHIALVFEDTSLTYEQLEKLTSKLALYIIQRHRIAKNDHVGFKLQRSENVVIAIIAILKAGAAYVPIDPHFPTDRIEFIQNNSNCKLIIDQNFLDQFMLDHIHQVLEPPAFVNFSSDQLPVYILYTSGTTGLPKGVIMQHSALANLIAFHTQQFTHNEFTRVLQFASFNFDVSFQEIFSSLTTGASLYIASDSKKQNFSELRQYIIQHSINTIFLPTAYFKVLIEDDDFLDLFDKPVKNIIVAGEQLSLNHKVKQRITSLDINIHNHYGPTESHVVTSCILNKQLDSIELIPPIGKPIWNTQIYILDEQLNPVPIGITGNIYISGKCLAKGYINNDSLTKEKFIHNPFQQDTKMYYTGDLGYWRNDGNIIYAGRKDQQVKISGYRIEPAEIETVISQYQPIQHVVVLAKNMNKESVLVAYYTASDPIDKTLLREYLKSKIPAYMIPAFYVQLDSLPLTSNGKIDRITLPDVSQQDIIRNAFVEPRNEVEIQLVAIWKDILALDNISITDNFFELGGNSLKAVRVLHRINKAFNLSYSLSYLFNYPTISELGEIISIFSTPISKENEFYKV